MKFLLISEFPIDIEQFLKMFIGDYIEHESDVIIQYNIEGAKKVIINELIESQKHFDFILADFKTDNFYKEYIILARWLRECEYTYSAKNFKLSSIPIFLMNNSMDLRRQHYSGLDYEIENAFDGLVYKPDGYKRIGTSNSPLAKGLDKWLDKLKSDLDDLDLDSTSDFSKVDNRILNARLHKMRILAVTFIENTKPLDYLWLGNSLNIIESTGDRLISLLKTYSQNPSKRNEKEIHGFLKTYNHLLRTESYCKSIYEQHFFHNSSRRYEEVDFFNAAYNYSITKNELFEVKLPNQRFYSKKNYTMLKIAKKYFQQIGVKYPNYFSNENNLEEIMAKMKKHDVSIKDLNFQYSLLMGIDEDKQQNQYELNSFTSTLNTPVRLFTYDDLLRRHHYLHLRVTRFGVN